HEDGQFHLPVDFGTVGGDGGDLHGAAAHAGNGGGAVAVVGDAGVGVADAPAEHLGDVLRRALGVVGDRLHAQRLADADFGLLRVHEGQLDLAHRHGDIDGAGLLDAVVGGGGDDGHAFAHA